MKVAFRFMHYEAHFMISLSGMSCLLQSLIKLLTDVINKKPRPILIIVQGCYPLLLDLDRQ
jgi:hypothetical protein